MILAIDPDVFHASRCAGNEGSKCRVSLIELLNRQTHWRLAVDGGDIEREYLDYFTDHLKEKDDPAIGILEPVLQGNQERRISIPNARTVSDERVLVKHGCTTKVEPELLGMVSNEKKAGLKLLLAGDVSNCPTLRHRGLNDPSIRHKLKNHWPWLDVHFANESLVIPAPFIQAPQPDALDRIFELLVPQALQKHFPNLRCSSTPPGVGEQIDVYGYMDEEGARVLVVGESKHRREGNESRNLSGEEVRQLLRKIKAVEDYENSQSGSSARLQTKVKGIIVSNAHEIDQDARELARQHGVKMFRAYVPSRRSHRVDWSIDRLECILE